VEPEDRRSLLPQLFPSTSRPALRDALAFQRPSSVTGTAVLSLWALQASRHRTGAWRAPILREQAAGWLPCCASPRAAERAGCGGTSPPVVLLGRSRGAGEARGTEQLAGMGFSCVSCSATASLAARLLRLRACVLGCEEPAVAVTSARPEGCRDADEQAGMRS